MDCSPPCSSVHEISQARILEWVAMPSPGDLPNLGSNLCLLRTNVGIAKTKKIHCEALEFWDYYFNISSNLMTTFLFIQQIFVGYLLCVSHCSRCHMYSDGIKKFLPSFKEFTLSFRKWENNEIYMRVSNSEKCNGKKLSQTRYGDIE